MTYITPEVETRHMWGWDTGDPTKVKKECQPPLASGDLFHHDYAWDQNGSTTCGPLFADPFPIHENLFLAGYNRDRSWNDPTGWQLALVSDNGMRLTVYQDKETSCWCPIIVQSMEVPPVVAGTRDPELAGKNLAQVTVTNVYQGLDGVEHGMAKYIRVNEQIGRPWGAKRPFTLPGGHMRDEFDQQHAVLTSKTHLGLKVQLGIVPVEEDGSANFLVPADRNIYFQLLDADYREIQRERTFVNYRPGEVRSCIGCHETASETLVSEPRHYPTAMSHSPVLPGPQPGETSGARPLYYPTDIQPLWDRYCLSCHAGETPSGNLNLTGTPTKLFSRSYEEIMKRKPFPVFGENHPKSGNNHYLPPYTVGAHASSLIRRVLDDRTSPCYVEMPLEDRVRLTTWVESNGQYYGSYYGTRNLEFKDSPDFRPIPTLEDARRTSPVER